MLDAVTKRRIDTARNILVGRVPDPKSQVEQITIALIYKFMDDMDAQSEELGGQRKFFAGDFAHYGWARLLRAGLGGQEMLNRYAEAIYRMPENPGLPPLFRNIFSNAYLPYRDPETLREFLKVIDEFSYDDSESLGDAFESLLAALDSQGDAGQFRTPRHIIDFIVAVIDPQKNETILDPACGTAGFLISAYKHILAANTDASGAVALTPDERRRLAGNLHGYDLSPDLVRLSLVNMYLHGFADPQIYEYDTLTSEERWQDFADVIMANPPFMSPKGGIRPHNRFSVPSRRSEVLFVDYIAEHLTPGGRAGVIVPEGVIFQSQRGHTQLRRLLVADYLVAVVSLPAGVFQPYSGVKTSILILDRTLASRADGIAFFKIASDGYDLGAQRRPIDDNDLPIVQAELSEYLQRLRAGIALDNFAPTLGLVVSKERIAADGEYNLSGERYKKMNTAPARYPMVRLGEPGLFEIVSGGTPDSKNEEYWDGNIPWITLVDLPAGNTITEIRATQRTITEAGLAKSSAKVIPADSIVVSSRATIGRIGINRIPLATNQGFKNVVIKDKSRALPEYIANALTSLVPEMQAQASGATYKEITKTRFSALEIPLPPLDVQRELVAEIEGYQRVIDGCRAVMDNWQPRIAVDPGWEMVELGAVLADKPKYGSTASKAAFDGKVRYVRITDITDDGQLKTDDPVSPSEVDQQYFLQRDDLLIARSGSVGRTYLHQEQAAPHQYAGYLIRFRIDHTKALPKYIYYITKTDIWTYLIAHNSKVGTINNINARQYSAFRLPIPPIPVQQAIVSELEAEAAAVEQARGLAERMAGRIAAAVGRVWGSQ